jgi:hypothetical protein
MSLKTLILSVYKTVNTPDAPEREVFSSSAFSMTYAENVIKSFPVSDLGKGLPCPSHYFIRASFAI